MDNLDWNLELETSAEDNSTEGQLKKSLNIYDHPVVQELMSQVDKLTEKISTFEKSLKDFDPTIKKLSDNREILIAEYQAKLDAIDMERAKIVSQKRDIEYSIDAIRAEQHKLKGSLDKTVEELKAKSRIQELEVKWRYYGYS